MDRSSESSNQPKEVLFARGSKSGDDESQDDVWDDRSLIRAYDRTVNRLKKEISSKLTPGSSTSHVRREEIVESDDESEEDDEEEDEDYEMPGVDLKKPPAGKEFKVGDLCIAIFSEDGLAYPAKIIKIIDKEKCVVQYLHYLNEEEQSISELYEYSEEETDKKTTTTSVDDTKPAVHFLPEFSIPPPPLPFSVKSFFGNQPGIEVSQELESSMHAMLMSWYMSGYHTGYFLGLSRSSQKKS